MKISISILLIFATVATLEIVSRVIWPHNTSLREITRSSDQPEILFELKPNTTVRFSGQYIRIPPTTIHISSQGIRDYEYSIKKPAGVYRIIILGDSTSFGWGVELEQTFAKQLERMSNLDRKCEILNFSVPGYNTTQEVATLESKCLAYNPDLIIFYVCSNDYQLLYNYLYPLPILKYIPGLFYKSHLFNAVITRIIMQKEKKVRQQFKEGCVAADSAIEKLSRLLLKHDFKVLFYPDIGWMRGILMKYGLDNNILPSKIDYTPPFIFKDGHPVPLTHKKMAEEIYRYLKEKQYLINEN